MCFKVPVLVLVASAVLAAVSLEILHRADASEVKIALAQAAVVTELKAKTKRLEALVPNQAIVMTHVAYHFTNLWFAGKSANWGLADFYLGEVRDNLKWAVRVQPVREGPSGEVNVAGIAEAVDNTEFAKLEQAIHQKQPGAFVQAYDETLTACHACHQAIGKPQLRLHRPASPAIPIMTLEPEAKPSR